MESIRNRSLRSGAVLSLFLLLALACDDNETMTGVDPVPDISVDAVTLDLGEVDINFGAAPDGQVVVSNRGGAALSVTATQLTGDNPGDFSIVDGGGAFTLAAGATRQLAIRFDPSIEGARTAVVSITSDDPDQPTLEIALSGSGAIYRFVQVDRMGIPALNTVFNHPPAFSKLDYNVAGPAGDIAAYQGLFETVLEAVGNADPTGTALLLLPDELPVSLSASPSSFATLTGRELADDATDVALQVVVGIESLQSDNVPSNDVPFLNEFPYLAPAN